AATSRDPFRAHGWAGRRIGGPRPRRARRSAGHSRRPATRSDLRGTSRIGRRQPLRWGVRVLPRRRGRALDEAGAVHPWPGPGAGGRRRPRGPAARRGGGARLPVRRHRRRRRRGAVLRHRLRRLPGPARLRPQRRPHRPVRQLCRVVPVMGGPDGPGGEQQCGGDRGHQAHPVRHRHQLQPGHRQGHVECRRHVELPDDGVGTALAGIFPHRPQVRRMGRCQRVLRHLPLLGRRHGRPHARTQLQQRKPVGRRGHRPDRQRLLGAFEPGRGPRAGPPPGRGAALGPERHLQLALQGRVRPPLLRGRLRGDHATGVPDLARDSVRLQPRRLLQHRAGTGQLPRHALEHRQQCVPERSAGGHPGLDHRSSTDDDDYHCAAGHDHHDRPTAGDDHQHHGRSGDDDHLGARGDDDHGDAPDHPAAGATAAAGADRRDTVVAAVSECHPARRGGGGPALLATTRDRTGHRLPGVPRHHAVQHDAPGRAARRPGLQRRHGRPGAVLLPGDRPQRRRRGAQLGAHRDDRQGADGGRQRPGGHRPPPDRLPLPDAIRALASVGL
ncbi:MAG: hypothetical protein AVDCRST_MAG10-1389, partial [uncultured Acidimicrobiales bacterium]